MYTAAQMGRLRCASHIIRVGKQARIAQLDRALGFGSQVVGSNPAASLPLGQVNHGKFP